MAITARRAGWIGCNILLNQIPEAGKIDLIRDGQPVAKAIVRQAWHSTLFLRTAGTGARGWLLEVMRAVEDIGRSAFTLDDVYSFEGRLQRQFPSNKNVRAKVRQQLQVLRDKGYIEFLGGGSYRLRQD